MSFAVKSKKKPVKTSRPSAADWYNGPSYVVDAWACALTAEQEASLIHILGRHNLSASEKRDFLEHVSRAIGGYQAVTKHMESMKPKEIGKRLRWVRDNSLDILANEQYSISNLDQVTKSLLSEALLETSGMKLKVIQDGILALCNAARLALVRQKQLPNRWLDRPVRDLGHRLAIILRDVAHIEPTMTVDGTFAQLVKAITKIAGRRKISKEIIFEAVNRLHTENVIRTDRPGGLKNGKRTFEEIPVSDICPYRVGYQEAGKRFESCRILEDGTVRGAVYHYKGDEPILVTDSSEYHDYMTRAINHN